MRCEEYRDRLTARLDGELPATETRAHDEHADACVACRALRDERRQERDRWRTAWRDTAPADLRHEILTAEPPAARPARTPTRWLPWAAAAALVLMLSPLWRSDPQPAAEPFSAPCDLVHDEAVGEDRILVLSGRLI